MRRRPFRSPNAMSLFSWWEDGELRTRFEGPHHREGSTPDYLLDLMRQTGFDLEAGTYDLETTSHSQKSSPASI